MKAIFSKNYSQIDLSAASVNGDLFDPSLCDLLLDSSGNEKDGGLVFETVDDPTSWTYLETVPTLQTYMKSEEDHNHLPDVLVNPRFHCSHHFFSFV